MANFFLSDFINAHIVKELITNVFRITVFYEAILSLAFRKDSAFVTYNYL